MDFRFGVRSTDIEQANRWFVNITGLVPEARQSSDLGGDYFSYTGPVGEDARLFNNRDSYDGEPVIDGCDEWPMVIFIEGADENSTIVQSLLKDTNHFVLVGSK